MTHRCPIDGCTVQTDRIRLMCRFHWQFVPYRLTLGFWLGHRNTPIRGPLDEREQATIDAVNRLVPTR